MLDAINAKGQVIRVIHGGAVGADLLAGEWVKADGSPSDQVYTAQAPRLGAK